MVRGLGAFSRQGFKGRLRGVLGFEPLKSAVLSRIDAFLDQLAGFVPFRTRTYQQLVGYSPMRVSVKAIYLVS